MPPAGLGPAGQVTTPPSPVAIIPSLTYASRNSHADEASSEASSGLGPHPSGWAVVMWLSSNIHPTTHDPSHMLGNSLINSPQPCTDEPIMGIAAPEQHHFSIGCQDSDDNHQVCTCAKLALASCSAWLQANTALRRLPERWALPCTAVPQQSLSATRCHEYYWHGLSARNVEVQASICSGCSPVCRNGTWAATDSAAGKLQAAASHQYYL